MIEENNTAKYAGRRKSWDSKIKKLIERDQKKMGEKRKKPQNRIW